MSASSRRWRIAARLAILSALTCVALPAPAGTGEDLARAIEVFERLKTMEATAVNRLDQRRRADFWSHYYEALEQLGRMKVHQQMMTRHRAERGAQFDRALREFGLAIEVLTPMLSDLDN